MPTARALHAARRHLDVAVPFTRAAALSVGLTDKQLCGPLFRRIMHGIYISAAIPRHRLERVWAALLTHPADAFASHSSAARVYGVPLPEHLSEEHVTVLRREERRPRREVRCHLADSPVSVLRMYGLRVSAPDQLFVELAAVLNLVELVIVGDALVRTGRTTVENLLGAAASYQGKRARLARRAAGYVRADVDSPMETRLRMLLVLAGLPEPEINFKVYYADGRLRYRFDLSYPDLKLVVEYDGRQHRDDLDQWDRDNDRDDWFDHHGWLVVKVFSRGIFKEPDKTLRRVRAAILLRGGHVRAQLRDDWRPFFPTAPGSARNRTMTGEERRRA